MTPPGSTRRVPDLFVERVMSGEASPEERARVLADPDAKARLDDLVRQNAIFHVKNEPEAMLRAIDARARERSVAEATAPARRASWWPVLAVGAPLAVLALLLTRMPLELVDPSAALPGAKEQTTTKGLKARLRVSQNTPRGLERVSNEEVLFAGDEIQVFTVSGDATHGVVVSWDGRGGVTRHFPAEGSDDTTLRPGQHPLGRAFQLDDAPEFERFVFVTDDAPVDVSSVVEAARRAAKAAEPRKATLRLPEGLDQTTFTIRKGRK